MRTIIRPLLIIIKYNFTVISINESNIERWTCGIFVRLGLLWPCPYLPTASMAMGVLKMGAHCSSRTIHIYRPARTSTKRRYFGARFCLGNVRSCRRGTADFAYARLGCLINARLPRGGNRVGDRGGEARAIGSAAPGNFRCRGSDARQKLVRDRFCRFSFLSHSTPRRSPSPTLHIHRIS